MEILIPFVLWTWGLTPVWVNVVGTILCGLEVICSILKVFVFDDKTIRIKIKR